MWREPYVTRAGRAFRRFLVFSGVKFTGRVAEEKGHDA
jgi:hypothetical protein